MKKQIWNLVRYINIALGFMTCLYLMTKSLGIFALVLAIFITYLNMKIDEILKGTD